MIKREETLLHAIGELPEEIVAEEDMDALKLGARQLEQEEEKNKLIYISHYMMMVASCIIVFIIFVNVLYKSNINKSDDNIQHNNIYSDTDNNTNYNNNNSIKKKSANVFVMDIQEKMVEDSLSSNKKKVTDNAYSMKKIPHGKTVQLHLTEHKYIVFSLDINFHLITANKKNKAYKAKKQVYFDVSSNKTTLDVVIPKWKKQGISIIAYAETDKAGYGTFYIGKSENGIEKNNEKGDIYYGIFIKED